MVAVAQTLMEPQIHYSRRDREGEIWPIKVWEDPSGGRRFEVERPDGPKRFHTVKATLAELHGAAYQTWGWERYAACGRWAPEPILGEPELTIVAVSPNKLLEPSLQTFVVAPKVRKGVDLKNRHHEVVKLLYAGFGAQIHANGYDFEDVRQEVFRKLLVSNQGKSPWDPTKSSFGHFVHMVCRSALYNLYRKNKRRKECERLGGYKAQDGEWVPVDLADRSDLKDTTALLEYPDESLDDLADHLLRVAGPCPEADTAVEILPYVQAGYGRGEIAHLLGYHPLVVSKGLAFLREHARTWPPYQGQVQAQSLRA